MVGHGDAALDRRADAQPHRSKLKPCIDERLLQRHGVRAALAPTYEEVRTESFPFNVVAKICVELTQPLVDENRNRRVVEKVLSAANFYANPALLCAGLRVGRIAEEMKMVVLLTAVGLSFARPLERKKRGRAIAGNSRDFHLDGIEGDASQALDRIATDRFERADQHRRGFPEGFPFALPRTARDGASTAQSR